MSSQQNVNGEAIPGCIRKLNNVERIFYLFPGYSVAILAKITGTVGEERFRRAIEDVRRMHPLVGAKVVFDSNHDAWFSSDSVLPPEVRVVARTADTQWFAELQAGQRVPFTPEKSPMVKFILVTSPGVSELVVIASHAICDGMALATLVRDILERYTNPETEISVKTPVDIFEILPRKETLSLKGIMTRLAAWYGNYRFRKNPYYFSQEDYEAVNAAYWERWDFGTVLLTLEPDETKDLISRCRKEKVTVGTAITTACLAAHEEISGAFTGNFRMISIPFDLRRHTTRPLDDVFCLCAGSSQLIYTYQSQKPFFENAAVMHAEIEKKVGKLESAGLEQNLFDPSLVVAFACFAILAKSLPGAFRKTQNLSRFIQDTGNVAFSFVKNYENTIPGTISSNLGRLSIPDTYGDLRLEQVAMIPPISESVPLFLGGATIGGRLSCSFTFAEPRNDKTAPKMAEMIRIRNRVYQLLGFSDKASNQPLG